MIFNTIISNPPYQEKINNNNGNSAKAIYQNFIDKAEKFKTEYMCFIIPSRWISDIPNGISQQWLNKMRIREDYINFVDYYNSTEIFEDAKIAGGVCYFVIRSGYIHQIPKRKYIIDNTVYENHSKLALDNEIIRDLRLRTIVEKVKKHEDKKEKHFGEARYMSQLIGTSRTFSPTDEYFNTSWTGYRDKKTETDYISYYTSSRTSGKNENEPAGYISEMDLAHDTYKIAEMFKCFIQITGPTDKRVINIPFIGLKDSCCSRSFAPIYGSLITNIVQANNMIKYFKTKFFRALVQSIKSTQHASRNVYKYVPVQDFTPNTSDINWSTEIKNIDKQLYIKYNLSNDEINIIEDLIDYIE